MPEDKLFWKVIFGLSEKEKAIIIEALKNSIEAEEKKIKELETLIDEIEKSIHE